MKDRKETTVTDHEKAIITDMLYYFATALELPKHIGGPIIKKIVNEWLGTQKDLDFTMGGDNVYNYFKTDKGKRVNYGLCVASELTELQDSIPWKHWKDINAEPDLENFKTEEVDLMHFLPSIINSLSVHLINANNDIYGVKALMEQVVDFESKRYVNGFHFIHGSIQYSNIYMITTEYLSAMHMLNADIIATYSNYYMRACIDGNINDNNPYILTDYIRSLFSAFIGVVATFKLHSLVFNVSLIDSIDAIWSAYLVKNVLNAFRVQNGYKEGTYVKIWDGEEDNVVVNRIALEMFKETTLNKESLYAKVEEYYNTIVK